jgi:ketosteroid isomerase-like protein
MSLLPETKIGGIIVSLQQISDKLKAAHEAYIEKVDINTLTVIYAPDVVVHIPPLPDIKGLEADIQSGDKAHQGFSDRRIDWEQTLVQGDTIALRFSTFDKHIPTGKEIVSKGSVFCHIRNDKIIEEFWYIDILGYFQQLGLLPAMG